MAKQLKLEFEKARLERDKGMATAAAAEGAAFAVEAYATLLKIARRKQTVHIDDVLPEMKVRPAHYNAWGAVWMRALRANILTPTGVTRPCATDSAKHAHDYKIYRSNIFGKSRFATKD